MNRRKGTDLVDYNAEARAANIAVMKLSTAVDLVRETEEAIFRKHGKPMQDTPEHVLAVNNRAVIRELVIAVGELGRILGDVLGTLDSKVTTNACPGDGITTASLYMCGVCQTTSGTDRDLAVLPKRGVTLSTGRSVPSIGSGHDDGQAHPALVAEGAEGAGAVPVVQQAVVRA
jgi:hypothetical protein